MGSTVVGQEAGRGIYPANSTAPDFEQGLVPGAFIGGAFGGAVGTQLGNSLCDIGVKNFTDLLDDLNALDLDKVYESMGQALPQMLSAGLKDLGVDAARATRFADQLQNVLRFVHLQGPADAVEFMTRELTREAAQLTDAVAHGTVDLASPAIRALAGFSAVNGAALELPPVPPSAIAAAPAIGHLQSITDHLSNALGFAGSLPATADSDSRIQAATNALRDGLSRANTSRHGLTEATKECIKKAGRLASSFLDTLDRLHPVHHHRKDHTSTVTTTHTHTTTATVQAMQWFTETQTVTAHTPRSTETRWVYKPTTVVETTTVVKPGPPVTAQVWTQRFDCTVAQQQLRDCHEYCQPARDLVAFCEHTGWLSVSNGW